MKISQIVGMLIMAMVGFVLLVITFGSWGTVKAGHRGVYLRMGAVESKIAGEGLYFKTPWIESVVSMRIQTQKEQVKTEAASKDLQTVHTEVAANLHPIAERVADLYQKVGLSYMDTIVAPTMQESIKSVIAQYTAEELVTKREHVRDGIRSLLSEKLSVHGITLEDLNIVNFDFSQSFNASIEAKVTAEQNALAAKNKLAQVEFEAQQATAMAKGKAQAMSIESAAIASNPQILQLRALEKWDGKMPQFLGTAMPFVDVGKVNQGK